MSDGKELKYVIAVQDDGSAVLKRFDENLAGSAKSAEDANKKTGSSFAKALPMLKEFGDAWKKDKIEAVAGAIKGAGEAALKLGAAIGVPLGIVGAALYKTAAAASENEVAVARLASAYASAGSQAPEAAAAASEKYANALARVTRFSDQQTMGAQAMILAVRGTTSNLNELTRTAQNVAVAFGMDLETASRSLARATKGDTEILARYGIVLDSNRAKTEGAAYIIQALAKYQGAAARDAETYSGKVAILGNSFGELQEAIGMSIVKSPALLAAIQGVSTGFLAATAAMEKFTGTGIGDWIASWIPSAETIVEVFFKAREIVGGFRVAIAATNMAVQTFFTPIRLLGNLIVNGLAMAFHIVVGAAKITFDNLKLFMSGFVEYFATTAATMSKAAYAFGFDEMSRSLDDVAKGASKVASTLAAPALKGKAFSETLAAMGADAAVFGGGIDAAGQALVDAKKGFDDAVADTTKYAAQTELAKDSVAAFREEQKKLSESLVETKTSTASVVASMPSWLASTVAWADGTVAAVNNATDAFVASAEKELAALTGSDQLRGIMLAARRTEQTIQRTEDRAIEAESVAFANANWQAILAGTQAATDQEIAYAQQRGNATTEADRLKNDTLRAGAADLWSALTAAAQQGGKSTFAIWKAFAVAQAIVSGIQATVAALASPPGPPYTIPLAAAVAVMSALNVAKIMATKPGGAASGGSASVSARGGAGGGGGGAGTTRSPNEGKQAIASAPAAGPTVTVVFQNAAVAGTAPELARSIEGLVKQALAGKA